MFVALFGCSADPTVKAAYETRVPEECNEREFWTAYFKSQYFTRDKGAYINQSGSRVIKQDDFFNSAQAQADADAQAPVVRTKRVAVADSAVDLTATAEEVCPSVFLAITPGGQAGTEGEYNAFRRTSEGSEGGSGKMETGRGGQGATVASASGSTAGGGMLPIMRKYNRNSELVLTAQGEGQGSVSGQGPTVPSELENRLHSTEDDALVSRPLPEHIALHMVPAQAPATDGDSGTSGNAGLAGSKRARSEVTSRTTRGMLARKSVMLSLGSVLPTQGRSLQFLRAEQQLALTNPAMARSQPSSTAAAAPTASSAPADVDASVLSTLRSVAGLGASTSLFLSDPSVNRDSAPSAAAIAASDAAGSTAAGTVLDLDRVPELSLEFKQQAMLAYLQVTELLRHFYGVLREVGVQQAQMNCKTPAGTPAYEKLGRIDARLREAAARQTELRNKLRASPVSAGGGWQMRLDILQDIIELVERSTDIWSKYVERCQYYGIVGKDQFRIDSDKFIRDMGGSE